MIIKSIFINNMLFIRQSIQLFLNLIQILNYKIDLPGLCSRYLVTIDIIMNLTLIIKMIITLVIIIIF